MRTLLCAIILPGLFLACNGNTKDRAERVDIVATEPDKGCEVHNIPLQDGAVPIQYGLIRPTTAMCEAQAKLFPHARSTYHDGCVVKEAKHALVSYCPKCRESEAEWKQAYARTMAPIEANWRQVRALIQSSPKFSEVSSFIDRETPTVGIEGRVKSDEEMAELKRLVETTAPPSPVRWSVRVGL